MSEMTMRMTAGIAAFILTCSQAAAAAGPTPFKLGTFEKAGHRFVGVVVRDSLVLDLAAANGGRPHDMKELIAQYDLGLRQKIVELAAAATQSGPHVHALQDLKVLPPIMYPTTMLNTAVNYVEHGKEMAQTAAVASTAGDQPGRALPGTRSAPGIWDRRDNDQRWNPYMFLKASSAVIADGESVRLPVGRTQIDWECELGVVIGKPAARVGSAEAANYIFGYTIENDVSDRGGRGDTRSGGSDWLIGKSHDTFAPLGPFIVPKEFVADPRNLAVRFTLNGEVMQQGSTAGMIHDVFEQVQYASNIMTLRPGDVIATGTPPGVGSARKPPIFLEAGDKMACTYEGVGTLRNDVSK
jgi:2-keto-4-pentenoate hydratase/2-oxohepta-3-ene-1,7-dioic acid hydratase in catechol pathway